MVDTLEEFEKFISSEGILDILAGKMSKRKLLEKALQDIKAFKQKRAEEHENHFKTIKSMQNQL